MSNLRRILPLLLCLSLLCACVQMPNAPKDETPLQSPLPTATSESGAALAPTATPEPTMVPAMAAAHDNATRTAPVIEDPSVWDDNAEEVLSALEKQFASYGMTLTAKEGTPTCWPSTTQAGPSPSTPWTPPPAATPYPLWPWSAAAARTPRPAIFPPPWTTAGGC